jgi:hypothetical protein
MATLIMRVGSTKGKKVNGLTCGQHMMKLIKQTKTFGIHFDILKDLSDPETMKNEFETNEHMTSIRKSMIQDFVNIQVGTEFLAIYGNAVVFKLRVTRPYYFDKNEIWNWPSGNGGFFHRIGVEIVEDYSAIPVEFERKFQRKTLSYM